MARLNTRKFMDWTQTISIIVTVLGSAYYLHRDVQAEIRVQSARSDKLYEIIIDMLKK